MAHATLHNLGWDGFFEKAWKEWENPKLRPGRVASQVRDHFWVAMGEGENRPARTTGRLRHHARSLAQLPVVGDWVAVEDPPGGGKAVIHGILPRKSKFSRKVAGVKSEEQVLVSNIDQAFLVMGLDGDYNTRRLERYLSVAYDSGARPVVLLAKADLSPDLKSDLEECKASAPDTDVLAVSSVTGAGIREVEALLTPNTTIVLLGSSGAGKSTLANKLLGEEVQAVEEVRENDSRGRHTTSTRQMFRLPGGALLIDTPGLREIQLWNVGAGVEEAFSDIADLAKNCRFRDCRHESEPGCAVKAAVDAGTLGEGRWASYGKLKKEVAYLDRRVDKKAAQEYQKKWKSISQQIKKMPKRGRIGNE